MEVVADEGEEAAERELPVHGLDHAENEYDHDLQTGQQRAGGPVHGQDVPELYPQLREAVVLDVELAELEALASEGADHADAGEVFLHHGGELALASSAVLKREAMRP